MAFASSIERRPIGVVNLEKNDPFRAEILFEDRELINYDSGQGHRHLRSFPPIARRPLASFA